ncbi:MAG: hypothetical protein A2Y55_03100 [Actinobacteria bacterium RBG_16_68_12]|nr:MAG: hypothetical protein A2Y55_03100 [Actinobacteria bacterium RBG_16_68_12]
MSVSLRPRALVGPLKHAFDRTSLFAVGVERNALDRREFERTLVRRRLALGALVHALVMAGVAFVPFDERRLLRRARPKRSTCRS